MPQRSLENVRPVPISLPLNSAHLTDDLDPLRKEFACTNAEECLSDMYVHMYVGFYDVCMWQIWRTSTVRIQWELRLEWGLDRSDIQSSLIHEYSRCRVVQSPNRS